MAGYVYLIGSPTFHWYKIGKSRNAAIRVSDLGILLPFRVEVIAVWKAENHAMLERTLHKMYEKNRINGEWFSFTDKEVKSIVLNMKIAATSVITNFSNIQKDAAPPGEFVKVVYKADLPPEEREARKQAAIAKREKRNLLQKKVDQA